MAAVRDRRDFRGGQAFSNILPAIQLSALSRDGHSPGNSAMRPPFSPSKGLTATR